MVLHTGMRTDIPAFYTPWFLNRLRAGEVMVRNPFNPIQVTKYRLDPMVVDLIGFCTKNPAPMLPHMEMLALFGQFWYVTITPYGTDVEPHVPPWQDVADAFCRLSEIVGVHAIGWRYDPIFLDGPYTMAFHRSAFARMAEQLAGKTEMVVINFLTRYKKTRRNFPGVREVRRAERLEMGAWLAETARTYGMTLYACGGDELAAVGADCGGCMTPRIYERALGRQLHFPAYVSIRRECSCYLGADIGAYDTCPHLCRYCYATVHPARVRRNILRHNPRSPFLIGEDEPGDDIHTAHQESWLDCQERLF